MGQLTVLPKAYFETRDFEATTLEPPMGSGAYELLSVDPGRSVAYKLRDDYWAKDLPVNVGQNNFDILRVAGRQAASYLAEAEGQARLVEARQFEEW